MSEPVEAPEKIVYITTYAAEHAEKATLPFVMANAALTMDVEAIVALQGGAVFLAWNGYQDHVFAPGLPPLKDLMKSFLDAGGKLLVCVPCLRERRIPETELIEGAQPMAAAKLTLEILSANAVISY